MARVAEALGVAWNTANGAVLAEGKRVLIADAHRLDGVRVLGVDEHVWRHTRHGDKYVTVVIDLTGIRDRTGPARLLDMIEGRSKQAFKTWLTERPQAWRDAVEVVAMDGFTGFKTATTEDLPEAFAVMDPFHVVRLAGRRPGSVPPAGGAGHLRAPWPHRRSSVLVTTDAAHRRGPAHRQQKSRLEALFAVGAHVAVDVTWRVYQQMIAAYRHADRTQGRALLNKLIDRLRRGVPAALSELVEARSYPAPQGRESARVLRPARHQRRPHRGHQRSTRTPPR